MPQGMKILVLADCCHSGTIADIDSYHWGERCICSVTACQDNETDCDTGHGGMLTIAIKNAVAELSFKTVEFSIQALFDNVIGYVKKKVGKAQHVQLKHSGNSQAALTNE